MAYDTTAVTITYNGSLTKAVDPQNGRRAHFEIVRTDAGWHARFRAKNGRIVWTTEVYESHRAAERACRLIGPLHLLNGPPREVDERGQQ